MTHKGPIGDLSIRVQPLTSVFLTQTMSRGVRPDEERGPRYAPKVDGGGNRTSSRQKSVTLTTTLYTNDTPDEAPLEGDVRGCTEAHRWSGVQPQRT